MLRLREATRPEHDRLESDIDIVSRLASREAYADLVARFYGFYAAFEPILIPAVPTELGLDLEERRKLPTLRRDLRALGIRPEELPFPPETPDVANPAEAIGCLYVVEGSTLGGQIISRLLKETLAIDSHSGGAFFGGYGPRNGPMWRAFGNSVNNWIDRHDRLDEVIDGAKGTFQAMHRWLLR